MTVNKLCCDLRLDKLQMNHSDHLQKELDSITLDCVLRGSGKNKQIFTRRTHHQCSLDFSCSTCMCLTSLFINIKNFLCPKWFLAQFNSLSTVFRNHQRIRSLHFVWEILDKKNLSVLLVSYSNPPKVIVLLKMKAQFVFSLLWISANHPGYVMLCSFKCIKLLLQKELH